MDIIGSAIGIVVLSPVLAATAIAVLYFIGWPILFTQVRPGMNAMPFTIYKFRTMTNQRDKNGDLLPDDDRLTKAGRFLRHWSLDELPQLFNVLKGDMSLVGPRPTLTQYVARYTPEQMRRFEVKPGMTGLAQVNGRNALLFSERLKYDIEYVKSFNVVKDLQIILLTVYKLLFKRLDDGAGQDAVSVDDIGLSSSSHSAIMQQTHWQKRHRAQSGGHVLLPNGGRWVGLALQLKQTMRDTAALSDSKLIVADKDELTPASCFADETLVLPAFNEPDFIERLEDACMRFGVGIVIPTMDLALSRIAPHKQRFAEEGITVACPEPHLVDLCLDKLQFAAFIEEEALPQPKTYAKAELDFADYPIFYKPKRGFGSQGCGTCKSVAEAKQLLNANPDIIFQQFIDAKEVSVDAYITSTGACNVCVPRIRDKVIGGEAYISHTIGSRLVRDVAYRLIDSLSRRGLRGPLNIQMFVQGDKPTLIEVNTRIGSATVLANIASRGRLFSSLLLEACGEQAGGDPDDYIENVRLYRFLGDVFHVGSEVIEVIPSGSRVHDKQVV
jgi:lipopolysaccharide/colanic/teichoic acid biosynthesis glycosyltransferase/predicted ATP-grasp superfamily ATP-dependent carboligase